MNAKNPPLSRIPDEIENGIRKWTRIPILIKEIDTAVGRENMPRSI